MRIDIITLFPDLIKSPFESSILKRAMNSGKADIHFHNLRNYATNKHKQVDDYPFGGGAGMVMMVQPIDRCIKMLKKSRNYASIIYLTPDGEKLNQKKINHFSTLENIIMLCGHYKGVDQRVRDYLITDEVSIGDFVLSGGELAATILCDCIVRLIPGVLGDESSALTDSFQDDLLAAPIYTRPANYKGWKVPDVLLSGNSSLINNWREEKSLKNTQKRRPDLLNDF